MFCYPQLSNASNINSKKARFAKEITFYEVDGNANTIEATLQSRIESLEDLPWASSDDEEVSLKGLARKVFADPNVSRFLIQTSRLAVFSKDLARSFRSDLVSLSLIKQLKYFYNQPTAAVLQQLASLVSRTSRNPKAVSGWNKISNRFVKGALGAKPVRHLLQEISGPDCYGKNAEYLEVVDPHSVYPTSTYRTCDGYVLANPDASVIESTMSTTLTTTIKIVRKVLDPSNPELQHMYQPLGRCVAVIDDKVEKLYGDAIQTYFDSHSIKLTKLVFSGNEVDKDISAVENILVSFKKNRVSRNEPVLVIGGGVISDIAGFATALYHRNTPYVMLCTSIVSGIDAGPSPRTCCDGFGFKNLYGAYHPPVLTLTDRGFFRTLHHGVLRHGIAEIVKMAVVKDQELFNLLEQASSALVWTKFGTEMDEFQQEKHEDFAKVCDLIIGKAMEGYVRSEYGNLWETHQCRPHAYGHTWSPGYELPAGMLHGHAVATGMGFGAYLSYCESWITQHELERILRLISDFELSLWHPVMEDAATIYKAQGKMMEKRGGNLVAPVPKGLGNCGYLNHLTFDSLRRRLGEYQEICQQYPRQGLGTEAHCRDVGLEDPSVVGVVNKELPGEAVQNGTHGIPHEPNKKKLSYGEWIDDVQKNRTKGTAYGMSFGKAQDTLHPPAFEPNELFHPGVEEYAVEMTQLPSLDVQQIAKATEQQQMFLPCMVGQLESQFLKMMAQVSCARRILDVGTFTGMSAMAFAEGIPSDGVVVTIEFDPKIAAVAEALFRNSSQAHKITLKIGDAVDAMEEMKSDGEKFDIVFLDAAKDQYISYYTIAKDVLSPSGFILADNSLCALLYDDGDSRRQALHDFNQLVKSDPTVEQLVLPIREGISIIRPRKS